jgi:hypothetical protein
MLANSGSYSLQPIKQSKELNSTTRFIPLCPYAHAGVATKLRYAPIAKLPSIQSMI